MPIWRPIYHEMLTANKSFTYSALFPLLQPYKKDAYFETIAAKDLRKTSLVLVKKIS